MREAETSVELGKRLGYRFTDLGIAERALTHRSAGPLHNERLEFLGDAAIALIVSEMLYARWPELPEGDLTRMRASLVNSESLARLARALDLGGLIAMGIGACRDGGFQRRSTLEDAFEAVIGAVLLDGGYSAVREVLMRLFSGPMDALPEPEQLKDPKTRLQELLQGHGFELPVYRLVESRGPDHAPEFLVECRVEPLALGATGCGTSRRRAEQAAAAEVLRRVAENQTRNVRLA